MHLCNVLYRYICILNVAAQVDGCTTRNSAPKSVQKDLCQPDGCLYCVLLKFRPCLRASNWIAFCIPMESEDWNLV